MTDDAKRMERLLLPRARAEPDGVEQPIPEARSPLPRWQTIPLDAKFPVLPAPKGEVTFVTTKLGQTPYKSSQRTDFDLSDPYNRTISSEYKALFDPYLKGWFSKPHVQKQVGLPARMDAPPSLILMEKLAQAKVNV
ncbi:fibrous sheath-interacting protein 2 [Plakobranchus ocellatus]|uniref:Fibrous sheath-interacting protein 2 n=1 Tax=Plakobranchus ocellatus TaxID=259542 RepID=A0AAV3Y4H5_9GAST|nr:fibrous sheath-interacting protein 2 [Plakobranchus ocellatus]